MSNKVNPMFIGDVDRLSKLNAMLAEGGIKTLSDEQFVEKMQDEGVRQKTYDFLVDSGLDVGNYTKFLNDFGFVSTPEQEHILPQAKMPSYEEFKENTIRHSVDGRLTDSSELLKRTTTNDWVDAQINKPLVDVVQQERDAVLRPSENVLDNIFESDKQYNEQKEAAKKTQSNYTAGAGAIKTPQMDTASKISYIGEEEYKYLKGLRNISISNIEDIIADAKKLYEEEKAQGNVKNISTRAGRTDVALTKSAERVQNLITHLEDLRKKYTNMVTEADKKFGTEGDLGKGLAEFDLLDFLTAGWKGVLEGVDKYAVAKKNSNGEKLTPEEQLYAKMFEEQARLEGLVEAQGGATQGYQIGSGVAESAPFITSMLTTSGVASTVKGGVNKALGAIGREAAKEGAEKSFKNFASRAVDGLVGSAAAAAVTTPLQAGMYNNYIDNAVNEYMTYGKLTDSPVQRLWKSYADAFTDTFTEHLGGVFTGAANYALKGFGAKTALGRSFNTLTRRIQPFYRDILKRTAYNGFVGEFEEEMWANFLSPLMRGDSKEERREAWREAFSKKSVVTTLATTALMSAGFGAGQVVSVADATRKYEKFKKNARNALANVERKSLEQTLVDIMALPTLQERCQAFANIDWQGDYKSMGHGVDYFYNSILKEVYDGVVKMEDANEVVMPTLRTLGTVVERGSTNVMTAQMEGKPVYVINSVDGDAQSVIVQDMEGNRSQVAYSSLTDVTATPVNEVVADLINKEYNAISAQMDAAEQAEEEEYLHEQGLVTPSEKARADQFIPEEEVMYGNKPATILSIDKNDGTARINIEGGEENVRVKLSELQKIETAPEVEATEQVEVVETPTETSTEQTTQEVGTPKVEAVLNEAGEVDVVSTGEEQTANYLTQEFETPEDAIGYVDDTIAAAQKALKKAQSNDKLPLNIAERKKVIAERKAEIAKIEGEIAMWNGVKTRLAQPQQTEQAPTEVAPEVESAPVAEQATTEEVAEVTAPQAEIEQEEDTEVTTNEQVTEEAPADEDIHTREQVEALEWEAGVVMNAEARDHKATEALDKMAKEAGVRVAFVDEVVEGGIEGNGLYDPKTKTIYIAANRLQSFYFVAGHEMLHHIKTLSPEAYKDYVEAVKAEMGDKFEEQKSHLRNQYRGAIISAMIRRGEMSENAEEIEAMVEQQMPTDETLTEEVVADWTGALIGYSDGFSRFAKRHEGSAMLRVFRNALEHLRTLLMGKNSFERTVQRRLKALDTLLDESIGKAKPSKQLKNVTGAMTPSKEVVEVAETIPNTQGAESKMSLMIAPTLEAQSAEYFNRYYQGKNASARFRPVSKVMSEDALKVGNDAISTMVEIMAPHIDDVVFGKRLLPEEVYGKGYTTIFKNGSYGRSMENTTNCVRTLAYNEFTDEVKKQIGRPLTTAESFLASQMLYDIAKDPQCLYCYVSLDRKAYDEFLLRYLRERDVMLKQYAEMEEKTPEAIDALYNTYLNGRKDTKPMRERFEKLISIVDNGGTLISGYDLMTREKRNEMRETSEDMRWQIEDAEKYAQGASWAKKEEEYRAYAGEILKMPFSIVKQLSEEYGLRFYSFSEYTPAFIVENMQMVRDAALRGLRGFAYTKEVDFVKIFAPTGMNMNVSTFGRVDSEGNVVPDERQGASWEEVKALREQYPNVGATFVATDDAMVEWALAQDWVDVVIPFHIVRTGADVAEFYKWTNYSSQQSDIKDGRKADIMPTEHHNNLETYLALCDERGITPRFSQWRENPNYMKLVNETRRSVDETPVLQPTFNLEAAKESWDNFVDKGGYYGGWYEVDEQGFNEAVEQVASDIEAGKSARDVDYGRQDIPADYAERARKARVNKSHGNTPKLSIKEMDAPYLEAVERGDMETAQRMVMEAAKIAMPNTKVVDEDGNPKVVYHQTNHSVYINRETGQNWDELDWRERMEWDERDDWDEYWEEREFNTFSRVNARTTNEFDGFFFAPEYDEYHEYGDRTIKAFLNIENPAFNGDYHIDSSKNNAGREERIRLQNEGFDGVIREYDGVVDEYIAFEPNQIKSADPVTYDDAGNVIPLSERFNPRKADIRYSLIGEMGARNLDLAEEATIRLDNLNIAREMESAGKDAKTIKMATGWERGADYFWRYEIDDVKFVNPEEWVNKKGKLTLKDIVTNADELFAAYPELKDIKIKKSAAIGDGGSYNNKEKTITLSVGILRRGLEIQKNVEGFNTSQEEIDKLMDAVINVELRGTLVHEIQHAIQNIEGFARGGNANMVNPALNKAKVIAFETEMINQINETVHQYNSMSTMERRTPKGSQLRVQIHEAKKKLSKFQKGITLGNEGYRKLAGEVEARNIEKRLGLTPEERRATLAEATEDVARDDQIFILNGVEEAEKNVAEKETLNVVLNDTESDKLPIDREGAFKYIPEGGISFYNKDVDADIKVSRNTVKHTALHKKKETYAIFAGIKDIIENAVKIGNIPVAEDEKGHTHSVSVMYVPVNINGAQYSARLVVKELENKGVVLEELSLYNVSLHKENGSAIQPLNASNEVGGIIAKPQSRYKVKDLIHNSQEIDKQIVGVEGETLFSLRQPTDEPVTFDNFFKGTAGIWEALPLSEKPTRPADYESERWDGRGVSSRYWYGEDEDGEYVIRESNHWSSALRSENSVKDFSQNPYGKYQTPIASCRWALDVRGKYPALSSNLSKDERKRQVDEFEKKFIEDGRTYGKVHLKDLTHYEYDTLFSLRLPEYQKRFKALTEEYNALDKNDAKALADFRARKRTLVEEYWDDFARALGADVDARVIDSTDNLEVLRPYYDMYIERVRDGHIEGEEIIFEEFVEDYNKDEDMIAGHIYDSNIIFIDMAKTDKYTTTKAFTRFFIHEYAHTIIEREVSEQELIDIWNENANTEFGKSLEDGYSGETPNKLGNEVLAYTVSGIGNADIRPLLNYIEGDKKVSEDDVLKVFGNVLPLNAEKAKQLLKIIKNGYREKGAGTAQEGAQLLEKGESQLSTRGSDSRRPNGGYSAGETYIEDGRRVTVIDEDFSIVEYLPEYDESPKLSLRDPIERLREDNEYVTKSLLEENEAIANRFHTEKFGRKVEKKIFNYLADVQRMQENLYEAGVERTDDNDFINKMESVRNIVAQIMPQEYEKFVTPLLKVITKITKEFGFGYNAISDYLAAKHSIEREDTSGIKTTSEASDAVWYRVNVEKIVSDFESKVSESVREVLWKSVRNINQRTLDILQKVGVYTSADIEAIQSHNWEYYVPLQGWDTKAEELIEVSKVYSTPNGGVASNYRWQSHTAEGRKTKPYDPLATIVAKLNKAVFVAETNKALQSLYNLVTDATKVLGAEKASYLFKASDAYYRKTDAGFVEVDADEIGDEELSRNKKLHSEIKKLYNERKQAIKAKDAKKVADLDAKIADAKSQLTIFVRSGEMAIPKEVGVSNELTTARRVYFYMNGKRMFVQFVNPKYSSAISGQTLAKRNDFERWVAGFTRFLSQSYTTLNPEFSFATNPIRDFRDAVITHTIDVEHGNVGGFINHYVFNWNTTRNAIYRAQRGKANPLTNEEIGDANILNKDDRKALAGKYGMDRVQDTLFQWFAENGGVTGYGRAYSVQTVADDLKKNTDKLKKGDISTHANVYKALADSAEIITRYATFLASLDKGESVGQAVSNGRNVSVNFNRKGELSDRLGAGYSFFNASAQGIYKYLTLLRKHPKRFILVVGAQIAMGYTFNLLVDWLFTALLPDDDGNEMQEVEIPLWERLGYTTIPVWRNNGKVQTIRIPKSVTFASFSALGVLLNELQHQRITTEEALKAAASQLAGSWTYGFSEGAPALRAAVPTALQPVFDLLNNTDAFGREVHRTDKFDQGTPNSELGLKNVIPWIYDLTKALNKATGGNEFKSGVIDINPSDVQYIMQQYAGGFGVLARKTIEGLSPIWTDKVEFEMQNIPMLGRLMYTVDPKSWYPDYDNVNKAFGSTAFSNARKQRDAGYMTEEEFKDVAMRASVFKYHDGKIKKLIDLRNEYTPSSAEYKVINREINRQRGLVVKIFEEADFNNPQSIAKIVEKYDPNGRTNITNLYKEYAK